MLNNPSLNSQDKKQLNAWNSMQLPNAKGNGASMPVEHTQFFEDKSAYKQQIQKIEPSDIILNEPSNSPAMNPWFAMGQMIAF